MFHELKNKPAWQPSANLNSLKIRADIIKEIRQFLFNKGILEVETPVLMKSTVTDPHVHGIPVSFGEQVAYLQTSPEYAMKRLLAAGSGSIFQICKAFRLGDVGTLHNQEFTMLEWYRIGFDHHQLMLEMDELLQLTLNVPSAERVSYKDLFQSFFKIDPHVVSHAELHALTKKHVGFEGALDKNACFDLLFTHCIAPEIGKQKPFFLYDFPSDQAALAKIRPGNPPLASRFEVYFKGMELANGFHELQNPEEQRRRFENDLAYRKLYSMTPVKIDEEFLAALPSLPDCAGVALGIDRLVMLALGCDSIDKVLSFGLKNS